MKWDDLLSVPFKWGGRGMDGMDCYGIAVECCRRAGTPLADPFRGVSASMPMEEAMRIRMGAINAREAAGPAEGRVVYAEMRGSSHVGYMVARDKVLHAITGGYPRVTPLCCFKNPTFYDVVPPSALAELKEISSDKTSGDA